MNLSRALAGFLESSTPKKWAMLRPAASVLRPFSTLDDAPSTRIYKSNTNSPAPSAATDPEPDASPKEKSTATATVTEAIVNRFPTKGRPKRPANIPFQAQVANAVHLVGKIGAPIQTEISPNGVLSAISVLVNEKTDDFPRFWIPVIFPGDLAQIAACYLHEDNLVYITGQLSGDGTPVTIKDATANIQVLARSLSFVKRDSLQMEGRKVQYASKDESVPSDTLWNNLLSNPDKWQDNRKNKVLDSLEFKGNNSIEKQRVDHNISSVHGNGKYSNRSTEWNDLSANQNQWQDNRTLKLNGLVKPNSPDFKHKDTGNGLWLSDAPTHVLQILDSLEFNGNSSIEKQRADPNISSVPGKGKEDLWKALVDDPNKWWDNRSNKLKPNSPDFKHKDTGNGLWLSDAPTHVLQILDSLEFKQRADQNISSVQGKGKDDLWKALVEDPNKWWDNRSNKLKPNSPDFKHKDTGNGLWLSDAPTHVQQILDSLEFKGNNSIEKKRADQNISSVQGKGKEDLWKALVDDPNNWWDNRSNKVNPKSPDFKHKDSGDGLWLDSSTPSWVLPKLPPPTTANGNKQETKSRGRATVIW